MTISFFLNHKFEGNPFSNLYLEICIKSMSYWYYNEDISKIFS